MTASESPAIVDPSGQKIWPNPNAIQNVDSSQVIETGIAQFASSQVQALGFLVPGIKPLEVRAIRAVPAEGVSGGFLDFVMVSSDDAKLILALKRNCQVVFIK